VTISPSQPQSGNDLPQGRQFDRLINAHCAITAAPPSGNDIGFICSCFIRFPLPHGPAGSQFERFDGDFRATFMAPPSIGLAQGVANKKQGLVWVYHWGYSSAPVLQALLRHTGMTWTTGAVKQGWLRKTGTTSRERVRVVTLTEKGLAWVEQRSDVLLKYSELDPHRISPVTIWHNLLAQKLTLHAAHRGEISSFMTERVLATRSAPGSKQPDVVWHTKDGQRVAIEVELTAKWDRRFDQFVGKTIAALSSGEEGERARFDRFEIMTTSKAIASRYSKAFTPGARLGVWRESAKGTPNLDHFTEVPEWVHERISFTLISEDGRTISTSRQTATASGDAETSDSD